MKFTHKFPGRDGLFWAMRRLYGTLHGGTPEPVEISARFRPWSLCVVRLGAPFPESVDCFVWGDEIVRPEVEEVKA